jgi:hypothetical protein
MIQIEIGEKHVSVNAPTPNTYRAEGPTSLRDLQIQFEAELSLRIREKKRGPEGYRDDMLEWAKSELGCTRDEAKILWKNRSAEFPRVGRHKKPRPSRKIGTT